MIYFSHLLYSPKYFCQMIYSDVKSFLQEKIEALHPKWLKLVYMIVYLKFCLVISCLYLLKYSTSYTKLVDLSKLEISQISELAKLRGIQNEETRSTNKFNRSNLEELISQSGKKIFFLNKTF